MPNHFKEASIDEINQVMQRSHAAFELFQKKASKKKAFSWIP
ncbi:hypothetical protein [Mucilaginibacter sp. SP1R1]